MINEDQITDKNVNFIKAENLTLVYSIVSKQTNGSKNKEIGESSHDLLSLGYDASAQYDTNITIIQPADIPGIQQNKTLNLNSDIHTESQGNKTLSDRNYSVIKSSGPNGFNDTFVKINFFTADDSVSLSRNATTAATQTKYINRLREEGNTHFNDHHHNYTRIESRQYRPNIRRNPLQPHVPLNHRFPYHTNNHRRDRKLEHVKDLNTFDKYDKYDKHSSHKDKSVDIKQSLVDAPSGDDLVEASEADLSVIEQIINTASEWWNGESESTEAKSLEVPHNLDKQNVGENNDVYYESGTSLLEVTSKLHSDLINPAQEEYPYKGPDAPRDILKDLSVSKQTQNNLKHQENPSNKYHLSQLNNQQPSQLNHQKSSQSNHPLPLQSNPSESNPQHVYQSNIHHPPKSIPQHLAKKKSNLKEPPLISHPPHTFLAPNHHKADHHSSDLSLQHISLSEGKKQPAIGHSNLPPQPPLLSNHPPKKSHLPHPIPPEPPHLPHLHQPPQSPHLPHPQQPPQPPQPPHLAQPPHLLHPHQPPPTPSPDAVTTTTETTFILFKPMEQLRNRIFQKFKLF